MKRRHFLKGAAVTGGGVLASQFLPSSLMAQTTSNKSVVVLFLRGACDGLNVAPPLSGPDRTIYEQVRPTLAIKKEVILNLGAGYQFGLHPSLTRIKALFDQGKVAILPRAGSLNSTRSHFEQMDLIEAGTTVKGAEYGTSGYLGRVYKNVAGGSEKHWAVSMGPLQAPSLKIGGLTGLNNPLAIDDLSSFGKLASGRTLASKQVIDKLRLYQLHEDSGSCGAVDGGRQIDSAVCGHGNAAASMVADLSSFSGDAGRSTGMQLLQAVTLIKERGVRFVTVDMTGWDTHFSQVAVDNSAMGTHANLLASLDLAVHNFVERAKTAGIWANTTLVIMSEFGRTVLQNGTRGTDHGRGGLAFVIGGSVSGKLQASLASNPSYKYRFAWGLKASESAQGTSNALDVELQTDLRHVMARVLSRTLGRNYADVQGQFTGAAMPTVDYLRLFG